MKVNVVPCSCWLNAVKALDYLPDQTSYTESWIVEGESYQVVEHCWLALYGEIINPSLYTLNILDYFRDLKLHNPSKLRYFL